MNIFNKFLINKNKIFFYCLNKFFWTRFMKFNNLKFKMQNFKLEEYKMVKKNYCKNKKF